MSEYCVFTRGCVEVPGTRSATEQGSIDLFVGKVWQTLKLPYQEFMVNDWADHRRSGYRALPVNTKFDMEAS